MAPGNIAGDCDFTRFLGVCVDTVTGMIPCGTDAETWLGLRIYLVLALYPVKTRLWLIGLESVRVSHRATSRKGWSFLCSIWLPNG